MMLALASRNSLRPRPAVSRVVWAHRQVNMVASAWLLSNHPSETASAGAEIDDHPVVFPGEPCQQFAHLMRCDER